MDRYYWFLVIAFAAAWTWAAVDPFLRSDWLLENLPLLPGVPLLLYVGTRLGFSRLSWGLITLFLILHVVGAHYTYPHVPIGESLGLMLGGFRNAYDRLVHFAFGLLFYYPLHEIFVNTIRARRVWNFVGPWNVILSLSAIFEITEWVVVLVFAPHEGNTYLGAQGDEWDAQKDMVAAALGALITLGAVVVAQWWRQKQPAAEPARIARTSKAPQ